MDSKLRKILIECIRDIETGARDVEGCIREHPDSAWELRPHLELWRSLDVAPKAQPSFAGQQRGQNRLLGALADLEQSKEKRMIPFFTPALAKAAAVVAGVALLAGGAAGASAALGGPDVAGEVLSGIGISNASDTGQEHANPNAFEGSDNAGQGINNASDTGKEHANPNALDGPSSSGQGADNAGQDNNNASENGREHRNPNASDGPGNAADGESAADRADDDGDDLNEDAGADDDDVDDDVDHHDDEVDEDDVNEDDDAEDDEPDPNSVPVNPLQ